jgi:hypothetical protein
VAQTLETVERKAKLQEWLIIDVLDASRNHHGHGPDRRPACRFGPRDPRGHRHGDASVARASGEVTSVTQPSGSVTSTGSVGHL